MAAIKLLNLVAVISLAVLAFTSQSPVNALSAGQHLNRQISHQGIAHRANKRANSKRCKPKTSGSSASSSPTVEPHVAVATSISIAPPPAVESSNAPQPSKSPEPKSAPAAPEPQSAPPPPQPVSAPPTSGGGQGKVGIAWNGGNAPSLQNLVTQNTHHIYTWSPWPPQNLYGLEFVPMLWGPNQLGDFNNLVKPGSARNIVALNEPDEPSQLNLDPVAAAVLWKAQVEPKRTDGAQLWSPAVTSSARGEQWMDSFLAACTGCNIAKMALHFYDTNPQNLIAYVEHWHQKYGRDIVITEFACQNFGGGAQASMDEVWSFYKTVMPWLMSQPYVTDIFPFGFLEDMGNVNPDNQLMKGGQLTDLGKYIVNGPW